MAALLNYGIPEDTCDSSVVSRRIVLRGRTSWEKEKDRMFLLVIGFSEMVEGGAVLKCLRY